MEAFDTLLTLAEVSLGLAGFAGIVVVFGRGRGALPPADSLRLAALVSASLGTLFFSLIPIALHFLGVGEPELWQWSSAIMVVAIVPAHAIGAVRIRQIASQMFEVTPVYLLGFGACVLLGNLIAQVSNALGVGSLPSFGVYLAGLIVYLAFAATQFARMLVVRPGSS